MRVLVCGGRDYRGYEVLARALNNEGPTHVICGGASGADEMAAIWANNNSIPHSIYPANWSRDGKAAGPIRNAFMLADGKPDLVLAFPGGRGTADMVKKARAAGVEVREVMP